MSSYSTQNVSVLSLRQQIFKKSFFDQDDHKKTKTDFSVCSFFFETNDILQCRKIARIFNNFSAPHDELRRKLEGLLYSE